MTTSVTYRTLEGVPGQYFDCPYGCGMLSTTSCARLYEEAMSPKGLKEGRRISCRACPVGAEHAGVPTAVASASRFLGVSYCSRCHGDARRLIRGSICVSCYNREREVLIGKNAKGGKPVFGRAVGTTMLGCVIDGGVKTQVRRMDKVVSRLEAVLSVLRGESKTVSFGWVGSGMTHERVT